MSDFSRCVRAVFMATICWVKSDTRDWRKETSRDNEPVTDVAAVAIASTRAAKAATCPIVSREAGVDALLSYAVLKIDESKINDPNLVKLIPVSAKEASVFESNAVESRFCDTSLGV